MVKKRFQCHGIVMLLVSSGVDKGDGGLLGLALERVNSALVNSQFLPVPLTAHYTHTSPELQRSEIERAVRFRPLSLQLIQPWLERRAKNMEVSS